MCSNGKVKGERTAIIQFQRVQWDFLVVGLAIQDLVFQVTAFITLPLLQPVDITRANERVVLQNPEREKRGHVHIHRI